MSYSVVSVVRSGGSSSSSTKRELKATSRPELSNTLSPSPMFSSVSCSSVALPLQAFLAGAQFGGGALLAVGRATTSRSGSRRSARTGQRRRSSAAHSCHHRARMASRLARDGDDQRAGRDAAKADQLRLSARCRASGAIEPDGRVAGQRSGPAAASGAMLADHSSRCGSLATSGAVVEASSRPWSRWW